MTKVVHLGIVDFLNVKKGMMSNLERLIHGRRLCNIIGDLLDLKLVGRHIQVKMMELLIKEDTRPILVHVKELQIKECTAFTASMFNKLYHSRLPNIPPSNITRNSHYVCYLAYKGTINYATAIWSTPVAANKFKDGDKLLELRRLAISPESPFNTASWMIAKMIKLIKVKFPDVIKLISYQDTKVHLGTIYKASNWIIGAETEYISWNNRKRNNPQSDAPKIRWEYILAHSG